MLNQVLWNGVNKSCYLSYADYIQHFFNTKMQKISVDAGCTCPNRDGTVGRGGCTYCNNQTFSPLYCQEQKSVRQQLEEGKSFFFRKYPAMKYLAYFQSYTNTYGKIDDLIQKYEEALSVKDVEGLVVGTRPDCMPDMLLDYFADLTRTKYVCIEYGVESVRNETLRRINRGHSVECAAEAILRTAERHIQVGVHLILGLPGETHADWMAQTQWVSELPVNLLKLHQLQIVRGTKMAVEYLENPTAFRLFSPNEYVELLVEYLEYLRPTLVVERFTSQTPPALLLAPDWKLKNFEFVELLKKKMLSLHTWQGRLYSDSGPSLFN